MNKPVVFVLDDDAVLSQVLAARLSKYGCKPVSFSSGEAALEAIESQSPALILLDLDLGEGMTGFEFLKRLRQIRGPEVAVIIISGDQKSSRVAHAIELGANDYLVKPPLRWDFEEILARHLEAPGLAPAEPPTFRMVRRGRKKASLAFGMRIEAVTSGGFLLLADHLPRKGATFHLQGPELQKILPGTEKVLVVLTASTTRQLPDRRVFELNVEIDPSQGDALALLEEFMSRQPSR